MNGAMPLLIAGLFVLGVVDIHAQQDEIDEYIDTVGCTWDGCHDRVEVREVTQYVHRTVNGELVLETEKIKAIFEYAPPIKTLDDCTKSEGSDWWDRKFQDTVPMVPPGRDFSEGIIRWDQKFEGPKILPDLQDVVDSGAQRLCVTIVPDFDENSAKRSGLYEIRNSILNILSRNDVQIEETEPYLRQPQIIWAAIPASLLDDLVENDNVANIDVYGKTLFTPYHIFVGFKTKIQPILQQEIDSKMRTCHDGNDVLYDCPLDKNADDKYVLNVGIMYPHKKFWSDGWPDPDKIPTKQQKRDRGPEWIMESELARLPMIEFLESNNQVVMPSIAPSLYADITLDFLPELVAREDVLFIESQNGWLTAAGVDPNKKSDTIQEPDIPQIIPSDEIRIELHDDSAIIDITIKDVPKSIPISADVAGKKTTIHVNNKTLTDYEIVQNDGTTLLVLRPDHTEGDAKPVQMSVRQQIKDGIPPKEIQCSNGQPVMMRDRVACLSESSIQALLGRGIDIMRIR